MKTSFERVLSVLITASAVVVAGSVAHRTFFAQSPARQTEVAGDPVFVDNWKSSLEAGTRIGSDTAQIVIVDVADLECPVCAAFYAAARDLMKEYPTSVALVHVSFPLSYHRFAMPAARAAECALRHGRFQNWLDVVYGKQDSLGLKSWGSYAHDAGIEDSASIARCASDPKPVDKISRGVAFGELIGLSGTPTVLVNGWRLQATPNKERLKGFIDSILKGDDPFRKVDSGGNRQSRIGLRAATAAEVRMVRSPGH